ncbi:RHS repeat domain-containing protein [Rubritalea profundi]|nr:RHS repeat protein [Rubritalea profundi]
MTKGTLYFFTPDFTFPGRAGLTAIMPPGFTVTRDTNELITQIDTGAGVMDIQDGTAPDSIEISYKDAAGVEFRHTVVSKITTGGGLPGFRMDTTFDGSTTRHEQYETSPGTTVLEKGRVIAGAFIPLSLETLAKDTSTPGIQIKRTTIKERCSSSDPWQTVSDTETTWENQLSGWVKTKEIIDPGAAALTSTWTYYQPGEITGPGGSVEGLTNLKHHVRHDGYESLHTYALHYESITTPYAGNMTGKTTTTSHDPGSNTTTVTTTIGGVVTSKTVTAKFVTETESHKTRDVYTAEGEMLRTKAHYIIQGSDFVLKPFRVEHPNGTLTTYSYNRDTTGGYTTVTDNGATTDNIIVSKGTRTTTSVNSRGTTIFSKTQSIGYGAADSEVYGSMAVTSVDNVGRPLTTLYHPETVTLTGEVAAATNPAWTTTQEYNCCGVSKQTDQYGIITYYAYDELQRRIKTNRLGVTTETVRNGLITETHRYAETVGASLSSTLAGTTATLVSRSVRNLSGTLSESWSPDSTSTTAGTLIKSSSTATTYQPSAGLSRRTVTTTADGFTQTTDSFLDGRTATTSGDLSPAMQYAYSVNATGPVTTQSYLDGVNLRQTTTSQSDWTGRQLSTTYMDGAVAIVEYNALGQMDKSTDLDDIITTYTYNTEGERTTTSQPIAGGQTMVTLTERSFATATESGIGTAYKTTTTVNGKLVSTSFRSADGMSSKTVTLAGTTYSSSSTPANGDWTLTSTHPRRPESVQTYTSGRLAKTETFDNSATPVSIASTSYGYDTLGRTSSTTDSRTGVTTTAYLTTTADVPTNVTDPGSRTTAYTYDTRGRTITIDAPDTTDKDGNTIDNITHTSYYSNGQVAGTWGDQTYARFNVYDSQNRFIELRTYQDLAHGTEPTASTTGFASTKWNYNPTRGWLDNKRYDDNKGTDYTYTSAGRLETREWSRLNTSNVKLKTTYSYDQGQMVSTTYNDGLTQGVVYTYDNFGRPTVVTQGTGATANQHAYIYDAATLVLDKEIISYGNGLSRTLDRSQDGLLRPAGFQLMNGTTEEHATSYGYDAVGRLAGLHTAATYSATPDFSYAYLANSGSLLETVTGPAHTVTNTYETNRNVLTNKENKAGVNIRSNFAYTVNDLGQRDDVSRSGTAFTSANTETWNYNAVGETVSADHSTNNAFDRSYLFDGIGNRKKSADSLTLPATDNYTSNALNQYPAVGAVARSFDDDGNLTNDGTKQFEWDAENRLIAVKQGAVTVAEYDYDYQSRRITKDVAGVVTNFVYDGWNPIAEFTGTTLSKSYVWGMDLSGSMQGAGGVGGLLAVAEGSAIHYPV